MGAAQFEDGATVGMDLGTTYSAIAWVDATGHVEVISNASGEPLTPSVVYFDSEDTALVGREAAGAALVEPERAAACFKRDMGAARYPHRVCGRVYRPEVLSAIVLKKLKNDAERKIGPIRDTVITVPAYFDDNRRMATQNAGRIAGLKVVDIINEPTAAALCYAYHAGDVSAGTVFLVCDLGGGTFDATLMRTHGPLEFETIATDGDVSLGGKDWDERLLSYVAGEFMRQMGADPREDAVSYQDLVLRVEQAKRALSRRGSVAIQVTHAGHRLPVHITREKFESLTMDLLQRVCTTMELLLDEGDIAWSDLDRVLLVGGATRMPMIQEMVRRITGGEPQTGVERDLAIAQGAALHGASLRVKRSPGQDVFTNEALNRTLTMLTHRNVNSHSLGVAARNPRTGQMRNVTIIPRNTPIPCQRSKTFGKGSAGSTSVRVRVLEGEAPDPEACALIGECSIHDLPSGLPKGSPIDVRFAYSENGRIHISAVARAANATASISIARATGVTQRVVDEQTRTLSDLKVL